jgi:hypothetical protein
LILFTAINLGCSTKKSGPIVTPYYKSVVTAESNAANKIPFSVRINPIAFDEPSKDVNVGLLILKIFPLTSLIPKNEESWCNRNPDAFGYVTRESGDIEKVLLEELKKSALFNEVTFKGDPKDYDIRGKANFIMNINSHGCGLGAFVYLSIVGLIFCPTQIYDFMCEAHFDVVSTNDNKVLFSKDYFSKDRFWLGLLYEGNILKARKVFGEKVFPVIVEKFIKDLKEELRQQG